MVLMYFFFILFQFNIIQLYIHMNRCTANQFIITSPFFIMNPLIMATDMSMWNPAMDMATERLTSSWELSYKWIFAMIIFILTKFENSFRQIIIKLTHQCRELLNEMFFLFLFIQFFSIIKSDKTQLTHKLNCIINSIGINTIVLNRVIKFICS